ncbi:exosome complex exonuclease Rrp41 [Candidatus Bathyarchaeota archaeon]|jgi:exosome complex component RRP41|nr:exosome complex exonuclease Rrp41 [Candidatus Bathyarchaeota archaeon]|tara:strand:+ start:53 stop:808 length:756 start_codon:yes stop_codon:yes gene_type:complete
MSKTKKIRKKKKIKKKSKAKTRYDGRKANEMRPTTIESGVLPNADGSAYIEMGRNKILVGVFGPREMHPRRLAKPNEATVRCRYHMSPFSVSPRRSPAPSRRDMEIGMVMSWAIQPAIFLDKYPRSVIDVYTEILEADGGTRTACINASTVALVDAGIPMRDLVSSCAAGVIDGEIVLDLGDYEDKEGQADVPVAYMPTLGQITLLQMDGVLPTKTFKGCVDLAIEGCLQVNEIQKNALRKKYGIFGEAEE